jgi:hypothetical protein
LLHGLVNLPVEIAIKKGLFTGISYMFLPLGFCFFSSSIDLLGFLFGWMCNGANSADFLTASAKYNALVWVYYGSFLSVFFFKFEGAYMAVVDTFSAGYAFFVVYLWVPRYFFARNALIRFFSHALSLSF